MNEMSNQEPWTGIFKKCLTDLKEKNAKLSISQLASKINVARSTLSDHINSKAGATKPNLDNYIKVILESGNVAMFFEALAAYDENLSKNLKEVLSVSTTKKNAAIATEELETILEDRSLFIAYILASNDKGINFKTLAHILGNKAQTAMNTLIARGLAIDESRLLKVNNPTFLIRSFESIKHHLTTYAEYYKPHHAGKERNYAFSLTGSLNAEGIKANHQAYKILHETIKNNMRNPAFEGNIPAFSVGFCDTFTDINFDPEDKGELQ
ncbi:MAG: helix-turn-helix domain-containing protein [Bacteriovoracaceae bacterium]|nr:helix-turn-helix domain-containing protein [Bacteriovoracaceae bacterium]